MQEITTLIRAIGDIRNVSLDTAARSIAITASIGQIELAQWLFDELDVLPEQVTPRPVPKEYTSRDDIGRNENTIYLIFLGERVKSPQALQEIATIARTIPEIRRVFTYSALHALVLRGTPEQLRLAAWLADRLTSEGAQPASEYRAAEGADDLVRVFFIAAAATPQNLQESAVRVRSTARIPRVFTYNDRNAIAVRGSQAQLTQAEQLLATR